MTATNVLSPAATKARTLADVPNDAHGVAEVVVFLGHQSDAALARRGFSPDAVADAVTRGFIQPVPRLGGYSATRKVTRARLGSVAANLGR